MHFTYKAIKQSFYDIISKQKSSENQNKVGDGRWFKITNSFI